MKKFPIAVILLALSFTLEPDSAAIYDRINGTINAVQFGSTGRRTK